MRVALCDKLYFPPPGRRADARAPRSDRDTLAEFEFSEQFAILDFCLAGILRQG